MRPSVRPGQRLDVVGQAEWRAGHGEVGGRFTLGQGAKDGGAVAGQALECGQRAVPQERVVA
ncbi:hypothetical protein [Streptomyces sp. ME19-01-6]|uniref:hypothetical protein n=1 Tax=Streptomyces sp. ME19-01-6 TaxID=3028686 RepID=UPI0029A4481C|nr:hypothetical protein [Streptomyces sp. ME19-01-6]MDX3229033.1 hypothetical protein [Streptomyces sp. ME19-01-6]